MKTESSGEVDEEVISVWRCEEDYWQIINYVL